MVFPGRFSTGCKRCRQRKIKCDEQRPSCRRCQIYGKPCPGYTDQFHFRFDKSTQKQEPPLSPKWRRGESRKPRQPQPHQQPLQLPWAGVGNLASVKNRTQVARAADFPIARHLELSYDDVSICYFIRRFVTPDENDSFPGHMSFIPDLYEPGGRGLLEMATLSVAQMAAYNQLGGAKFRVKAYQNYASALRVLRHTIETQDQVTDDRVLAAVLLLTMFKDIGEDGWGNPKDHAPGIYYLLERRGVEQLCTSRGFELFLLGLLKLQIHAFFNRDNRYQDPGGIVAWLGLFDPLMRGMLLMSKVMNLRHVLLEPSADLNTDHGPGDGSDQSGDRTNSPVKDQENLQACFQILEEFDNWDLEAQAYWETTFGSRSIPAAFGRISTTLTYCDPRTACIIILVRSARLVLLMTILEYYDAIQESLSAYDASRAGNSTAWAECIPVLERDVRTAVEDMLHCVPFAMGERGPDGTPISKYHDGAAALIIIQPMRLVTFCPSVTHDQQRRVQDILNRMKSGIGLRSAMSFADVSSSAMTCLSDTPGLARSMAMLSICDKSFPPISNNESNNLSAIWPTTSPVDS